MDTQKPAEIIQYKRKVDHFFSDVAKLYDEAEAAIKQAEIESSKIAFPPVNELRYAGRHMVNAFVAESQRAFDKQREELDKAKRHCQRAIYDANEIPLLAHINTIRRYIDSYEPEVIGIFLPDFAEKRDVVREAADKLEEISSSRKIDKEADTRHEYVDWCKGQRSHLKTIARCFEDLEGSFRKKTREYQTKENREKLAHYLKLAGGLGIILTLVKFVWDYVLPLGAQLQ